MENLWQAKELLLFGTWTTFKIFGLSLTFAIVFSFIVGLASLSKYSVVRWCALIYGETFRGVSLLVQLFWIYFVLPFFGLTLSASVAAILALGICFGAYGSEIVRTSMLAIPTGQREAAMALGLSPALRLLLIELPQGVLLMLPPFGNLLVQLLKSTSVTALITIPELSFQAAALNNNLGPSVAVFLYVLGAYFAMSSTIISIVRALERRLGTHRT